MLRQEPQDADERGPFMTKPYPALYSFDSGATRHLRGPLKKNIRTSDAAMWADGNGVDYRVPTPMARQVMIGCGAAR
jgi:hypothetical protein